MASLMIQGVVGAGAAGASLRRSSHRTIDTSCSLDGARPLCSLQSFSQCKVLFPGTCSSSEIHQRGLPVRLVKRISRVQSARCQQALSPELKDALDKFVGSHKVVLFMKGNRNFPQCGFSNTCIQILNQCNVPYETVNILEDESLRQGVKEYSQWPTYPQLYIDGEFYGGCDITLEGFKTGELKETLDKAILS